MPKMNRGTGIPTAPAAPAQPTAPAAAPEPVAAAPATAPAPEPVVEQPPFVDDAPPAGNFADELNALMQGQNGGAAPAGEDFDFGGVDLGGVSDTSFKLLPVETDIDWVVEECTAKTASTGNKMLSVKLRSIAPKNLANVVCWDNVVMTGENPWKFKSFARACELLTEDGKRCTARSAADFVDCVVSAQVKHDDYQGSLRNKIAGGYTVGGNVLAQSLPAAPGATGPGQPDWNA